MEAIMWIENYLTRAEQMIYDGHVEDALNMLNNLLFEEPGYAPLHNHLGWAYLYHANNTSRAEMHFRVAMRFADDYAPPYLHMGTLLSHAGRYAEAIEQFRAGLVRPEAHRPSLLAGIAHAYEMQGEYRRASRAYKEAAMASIVDFEVDRMLNSAKRCRRKRIALFFSFCQTR